MAKKKPGTSEWLNFRADDGLAQKLEETVAALQQENVPGVSRASVIRIILRRGLGIEDGESVRVEVMRQIHKRVEDNVRRAMLEVGRRLGDFIDGQGESE